MQSESNLVTPDLTPTPLEIEKRPAGLKKGCGSCACHGIMLSLLPLVTE